MTDASAVSDVFNAIVATFDSPGSNSDCAQTRVQVVMGLRTHWLLRTTPQDVSGER